MADMNGQVALVTGGIRGIGLAIGERLMNRGVRVAAGYSSHRDDAQLFAGKYADHGVTIHQGNIGSNEDCVRVIGEVLEQHGQLDILVNNAGITVNTVTPGYITTEMTAAVPANVMDKLVERIPVGRLGEANEVARVVEFLADPESSYITGQVYPVNGGLYM